MGEPWAVFRETLLYIYILYVYLVGGLEHQFYDFPYIGNVVIPTDELIFFRGVAQPPTRQFMIIHILSLPSGKR